MNKLVMPVPRSKLLRETFPALAEGGEYDLICPTRGGWGVYRRGEEVLTAKPSQDGSPLFYVVAMQKFGSYEAPVQVEEVGLAFDPPNSLEYESALTEPIKGLVFKRAFGEKPFGRFNLTNALNPDYASDPKKGGVKFEEDGAIAVWNGERWKLAGAVYANKRREFGLVGVWLPESLAEGVVRVKESVVDSI